MSSVIGDPMETVPPSTVGGVPSLGFWQRLRSWSDEVRRRLEAPVSKLASQVTQDGYAAFPSLPNALFSDTTATRWRLYSIFARIYASNVLTAGFFSTVVQIYENLEAFKLLTVVRANPAVPVAGTTIAITRSFVNLNPSGNITMTATPTFQTAGVAAGSVIVLANEGNGTITLQDDSLSLPGSKLVLGQATLDVPGNAVTLFVFMIGVWRPLRSIAF